MLHFKVASIHVTRSSSSLGRHIAVRPDFSIVWEGQVKKFGPAQRPAQMSLMLWNADDEDDDDDMDC